MLDLLTGLWVGRGTSTHDPLEMYTRQDDIFIMNTTSNNTYTLELCREEEEWFKCSLPNTFAMSDLTDRDILATVTTTNSRIRYYKYQGRDVVVKGAIGWKILGTDNAPGYCYAMQLRSFYRDLYFGTIFNALRYSVKFIGVCIDFPEILVMYERLKRNFEAGDVITNNQRVCKEATK